MNKLIEPNIEPKKLRPVILTCDRRLGIFKKFVDSYKQVADSMLQPIILVGFHDPNKREEYDTLIQKLNPYKIIEQPKHYFYDEGGNMCFYNKEVENIASQNGNFNIQEVMIMDFPRIVLENSEEGEDIIFIEDDAGFSSQFPKAVQKASKYLSSNIFLITMHDAGSKYGTKESLPYNSFIHGIHHEQYSCNTGVIIKRELIVKFRDDRKIINIPITAKAEFVQGAGWDIKWWKYMKQDNLEMYATRKSYVRQIEGYSILAGGEWSKLTHPEKYSEEFEKEGT